MYGSDNIGIDKALIKLRSKYSINNHRDCMVLNNVLNNVKDVILVRYRNNEKIGENHVIMTLIYFEVVDNNNDGDDVDGNRADTY